MARTIAEIETAIIAEKDNQTDLNTLTSSSKTAIWRLWVYVVAVALHIFEGLMDAFKKEVQDISDNAIAGSLRWYKSQVLKWQYNHSLEWNDYKFKYAVDDSDARIVTQVAVVETNRQITIKVAKGDVGSLAALTTDEKTSLENYISQIKYAGAKVVLTSEAADKLKFYATIYYDAIKTQSTVQTAVEAAIDKYLHELPFNGVLKVISLIDVLQAVDGVKDIVFTSAAGKYGAVAYASFTREYLANAGYMEIDTAFPLSTTLTYTVES